MVTEEALQEYLDEIRQQVCERCIERPPGGPPCAPLGKMCGIEAHLPELIEAIHEVHSDRIDPYLEVDRRRICEHCAFLHSSACPCPMDYLLVLIVQAVETVDQRRGVGGELRSSLAQPEPERPSLESIRQVYAEAVGRWSGCDWPTEFGSLSLDLNGWTAAQAKARADKARQWQDAQEWNAAADWLAEVEQHAKVAQRHAGLAVTAAEADNWPEAREHGRQAWFCEIMVGRPLRRGFPATWRRLYQAIADVSCPAHPV
jgi:hypothetical protein